MPNGLETSPYQRIHPPFLFVLSNFPYCPSLLSPNLPLFVLFLAVNKPPKVCDSLLNGLYSSIACGCHQAYQCTLLEYQRHPVRGQRRIGGRQGQTACTPKKKTHRSQCWVKWGLWWWNRLILHMSAPRVGSLLPLINVILIIIIIIFPFLITDYLILHR